MRWIRVVLVSVALVVAAGCLPAPTAVHHEINAYRGSTGRAPLGWSVNLERHARAVASWNAAAGTLGHSNLGALLAQYPSLSACAENLAVVPSSFAARQIVDAWRASVSHNAALLGAWSIEGDASVMGRDGRWWVAAEFCR